MTAARVSRKEEEEEVHDDVQVWTDMFQPPPIEPVEVKVSDVNKLLRRFEAGTNTQAERLKVLPRLLEILQNVRDSTFRQKLVEDGLLFHLRAFLEQSLRSTSAYSHERRFRMHLLRVVDLMKPDITLLEIKKSRLNKALLGCAGDHRQDHTTRTMAFLLVKHFASLGNLGKGSEDAASTLEAISQSLAASSQASASDMSSGTTNQEGAARPIKRAKVRKAKDQ